MMHFAVEGYRWGRLEIPSRPENVAAVRRAVERLSAEAGLSRAASEDLDLAVTEACANAVRHGSPLRDRNTIGVDFYLAPECVVIEVCDEGDGFESGQRAVPAPSDLREGGYGLHIMRQVTDGLEIIRRGGTTVRLMKKRTGSRAPSSRAALAHRPASPELVPAYA